MVEQFTLFYLKCGQWTQNRLPGHFLAANRDGVDTNTLGPPWRHLIG